MTGKPTYRRLIWVFLSIVMLSSCTILHRIKEDEVYFKKHRIKVHDAPSEYTVANSELLALTKFKPNRRILLARFNLGIYTLVPKKALARSEVRAAERCKEKNKRRASKNKKPKECKSLWSWMAYTIGEPPAQLDSTKMEKSAEQMTAFLEKRGYFNNQVVPEVIYKRKGIIWWRKGKKCKLTYHIYPSEPYKINGIQFQIEDPNMAKRTEELLETTTLKQGMLFDVDVLDAERERIATYFNNKGYYEFTKDYIVYDVDSSLQNHSTLVTLRLQMPRINNGQDSLVSLPHKKFYLGKINVFTDFDPSLTEQPFGDTLTFEGLNIYYNEELSLKPSLLSYTTLIQPNEMYQKDRIDLTYKRFTQLGTNKAVNIQLVPRPELDSTGLHILDVNIILTPAKKQATSFDPRLTNRSGNTGLYGNVVYSHRNVFGGAEAAEIRIITGFEATRAITETVTNENGSEEVQRSFQLNTFEFGPELSLRIPRIVGAPFVKMRKNSEPFTSFSLAINYQRRPDYERTLTQLRSLWGFTENKDKGTKFYLRWDLSVINIKKTTAFEDWLESLNDAFLTNSYQNHLVHSGGIEFLQNSQKTRYQRFYLYHRYGLEIAGKVFPPLIAKSINAERDANGSYYFGGIQYADYVKVDGDSRFYYNFNDRNGLVFRMSGAVGFAGQNLSVLPFEESFFSGGANGIRAWQARTLGPGSYRDTTNVRTYNNIGDVKLEFNFEYRFKLTQMFQAAWFVDAGNIWLLKEQANKPGADFASDRFIGEMAIGSGFGIRLDFEYFLVRLDMGLQIKDPLKIQGERWFWEPKDEYNAFLNKLDGSDEIQTSYKMNRVFNLGIGFPF
jgi:outer membrane protein assembly factor BamA